MVALTHQPYRPAQTPTTRQTASTPFRRSPSDDVSLEDWPLASGPVLVGDLIQRALQLRLDEPPVSAELNAG
jgi:hypothetical protein